MFKLNLGAAITKEAEKNESVAPPLSTSKSHLTRANQSRVEDDDDKNNGLNGRISRRSSDSARDNDDSNNVESDSDEIMSNRSDVEQEQSDISRLNLKTKLSSLNIGNINITISKEEHVPEQQKTKYIHVDLIVPNFGKCIVEEGKSVKEQVMDQLVNRWSLADSNSLELYEIQALRDEENPIEQKQKTPWQQKHLVCKLSNSSLTINVIQELIKENQILQSKLQKSVEALLVYESQNANLKQQLNNAKAQIEEMNNSKGEMKQIVDSLIQEHEKLTLNMADKEEQTDNKHQFSKASPEKSTKRKQKSTNK
jgi:hypothetical protein